MKTDMHVDVAKWVLLHHFKEFKLGKLFVEWVKQADDMDDIEIEGMLIKEIDANAFKHFFNGWNLDEDYSLLRFNHKSWIEMADFVTVTRRGWDLEPIGSYSMDYNKTPLSKVKFPKAFEVIKTVQNNAKTIEQKVMANAIECHMMCDWLVPHHRIGYLLDHHSSLEDDIYSAWKKLQPFKLKFNKCKKIQDAVWKHKDCPVLLWTQLPRQMVINASILAAYYTYHYMEKSCRLVS